MSDLISRDDVYNVLKKVNIREMPIYVFDKLWNGIRDLPAIELKQKKSKWIHKEYSIGACYAECNECHQHTRGIAEDNGFGFNYKFYNFCPNCGADMR